MGEVHRMVELFLQRSGHTCEMDVLLFIIIVSGLQPNVCILHILLNVVQLLLCAMICQFFEYFSFTTGSIKFQEPVHL